MLRRLRRLYEELLDQSLHGLAWMELGLAAKPEAVNTMANLLFRFPQGDEHLLAPGTRVLDAYEQAAEELLILGTPGAGKSTLLLDLAQQLVERAFADPGHPLPVILRLSSWAVGRSSLEDWMMEQLSHTYDVPRQLSAQWFQQGHLLPLLDGLDEMEEAARPACIAAINSYHRTHLTPLVVYSRQAEYEVAALRERLVLQGAVIVQPLSAQQIASTLQVTDASFAGIRAALSQQPALQELASTPLMLSVLLLTYRGVTASEITQRGTELEQQVWTDYVTRQVREKGDTIRYPLQQTTARLSFLAQQLRLHQQTIFSAEYLQPDWLPASQQRLFTWLAIRLPSLLIGVCVSLLVWLFLGNALDQVTLLQVGMLGGFIGGCLSSSLPKRSAEGGRRLQAKMIRHLRNAVLLGVLLAASFGLSLHQANLSTVDYYSLSDWLRDGSILGLGSLLSGWIFQVFLERLPRQRVSVPLKRLNWQGRLGVWTQIMVSPHAWQGAVAFGLGIGLSVGQSTNGQIFGQNGNGLIFELNFGQIFGLNIGLSNGLIFELGNGQIFWPSNGLIFGLSNGLNVGLSNGLIFGLNVGLSYWLLLGLYQGMKQEHLEDQNRFQFNQGIRRSLRNGFLISLISAVIITSFWVLSVGLSVGLSNGLIFGLSNGLIFGLSNGLSAGLSVGPIILITGMIVMWALSGGVTILRHYAIRWLLVRQRMFPWRAQAFLDDATSRILLRRVGGGYSFIHRRLQDYLADATVLPGDASVVHHRLLDHSAATSAPSEPSPITAGTEAHALPASLAKPIAPLSESIPAQICHACSYRETRPGARFCSRCGNLFPV